jgi:SAM-dependent methyltransferase
MTRGRVPPYTLLARFYDQLTPSVPAMNRHARRRILRAILAGVRSVCDLGCGSGETALDFARHGLKVFALDRSPALCRLVRQKARRARLPVHVLCTDMRSFRLPEPVDLLTCEFAALNHLPRHGDLQPALRAMARALRPGGTLLFDVNTCKAFAEQMPQGEWVETRDFKLAMHGIYDRHRRRARLDFEWFLPSGTALGQGKYWQHRREQVNHICWSDAEVRRALRRAGFRAIRTWDGTTVRPPVPGARRGYDQYYFAQKD